MSPNRNSQVYRFGFSWNVEDQKKPNIYITKEQIVPEICRLVSLSDKNNYVVQNGAWYIKDVELGYHFIRGVFSLKKKKRIDHLESILQKRFFNIKICHEKDLNEALQRYKNELNGAIMFFCEFENEEYYYLGYDKNNPEETSSNVIKRQILKKAPEIQDWVIEDPESSDYDSNFTADKYF